MRILGECLPISSFLSDQIRMPDILFWVRNSYLTNIFLPRLSREDCSLVALDLTHMVVKGLHCLVKVMRLCDIVFQSILGLLVA